MRKGNHYRKVYSRDDFALTFHSKRAKRFERAKMKRETAKRWRKYDEGGW